ncbi:hypothetical protein EC973_001603 [Apophysomyces ossiformis]|uniref:C2 domain-containing protein n=1 Tax=Apophysomyces ossiformis TaxID=679940 RepID=A0A8H7EN30_9FUNG|nr:hypothetical protein EC973_001603 [Apophysomyces ossiformis]
MHVRTKFRKPNVSRLVRRRNPGRLPTNMDSSRDQPASQKTLNLQEEPVVATATTELRMRKTVGHKSHSSVHSVSSFGSNSDRRPEEKIIPADLLPDLHNLLGKDGGVQTELSTHDSETIRQTISAAENKSTLSTGTNDMVGAFPSTSTIPDWYRTGWVALSGQDNNARKRADWLDDIIPEGYYGEWWHNAIVLIVTAFTAWFLGKTGAGIGTLILGCLFLATYYQVSMRRFRYNARDDIQRELAKMSLEDDEEPVEWMNSFLQKFWLIFEPVMSALVVENLDTYITDYLPGFLDSVRLTTFTLGTKPFRIESVKTYANTEPDIVCMDWRVSFTPGDLTDLEQEERNIRVNPKIVMTVRVGKGAVGAGFPVLVEDMSFTGHMRVKIRFMNKFPYAKTLEACFLDKPKFDYVCKPLGTDSFGFDVNVIPGLQSFIRDQIHAILGPLMYAPNMFTFDIEKLLAGELDITQANGVLAITVYSASSIRKVDSLFDDAPNAYVRFYIDHAQELGRTSVRENTLEPQWNETRFLLLNSLNGQLSLELRTHNPQGKDRRLATAHFDLRELDEVGQNEQEGLNLPLLRNGRPVSDLRVDLHYLPVSKPIKRVDGTIDPAEESNSGILRLTVHECRQLGSNRFGSSRLSPYVRVIVNGTEKMKTSVAKRNAEPKYEIAEEMMTLDRSAVYLRVEVKDDSKSGEDHTVGVWTSYLNDMMRQQESQDFWWNIALNGEVTGQVRVSAQWKPVVMTGFAEGLGSHGYEEPPIGVIRFSFWEARDLRNVENMSKKSDPYVRVLSGNQIRTRTEVIDNNLFPEWGEFHYVPVHTVKENLVLEVMDWNAKSKDRSLGLTEVRTADLVRQCIGDQSVDPDIWYESSGAKIDKWVQLRSADRRPAKGELRYSAEFIPAMALPRPEKIVQQETEEDTMAQIMVHTPLKDLHGSYIKYTPDDMVDLASYQSGIIRIKIHEVELAHHEFAYCQVLVDSLTPQYKTAKLRGQRLAFDEQLDAFVKEADFSRVAIEVKPGHSSEKDNQKLGYWIDEPINIVRRIQSLRREGKKDTEEGLWFPLLEAEGSARIRLSFDYIPLANFMLNPDESLENQGYLTVTLLQAENLKAADKSGTSDPYVVFTVNGTVVFKSEIIKKTLNPVWKKMNFTVPIQSRVTASFRIEVFDWNQLSGDVPIGSGGITLRGDMVGCLGARVVDIPLDGVAGVSGSVRVRFLWKPQLLVTKKTQTSVLGNDRTYTRLSMSSADAPPIESGSIVSAGPAPSEFENASISRKSFDTVSMAPTMDDIASASGSTGVEGTITVHLIEARGIRGVDRGGTSDPYVRVRVDKQQIYRTKVIGKTLTPEWNESFTCTVSGQPMVFDFKVKDHNRLSHDVDLGYFRGNIWDFLVAGVSTSDQWLPLYPTGSGELHIRIEFTPR